MKEIFGTIAMIATFIAMSGFAHQAYKHYKNKEFSLSLFIISGISLLSISRLIYGLLIKAYFIVIPDIIGIVLGTILFYQYFTYKKK